MPVGPEIKLNPLFYEKDPDKKDAAYHDSMVSMIRSEWQGIGNAKVWADNMAILLSEQDMEHIKKSFAKSGTFVKDNKWMQVAVLDRVRNILVAEFLKAAYKPTLESADVSSDIAKKKDETILKGRKDLEVNLSDLNMRTGDPVYKIPADKYEGNVEMFDELGLDSSSFEDVNFFMRTFHRLWHEVDAQELLRSLMSHNEFENNVEDLVNDILAKLTVCYQTFASPSTGEIKWRYLKPEDILAIRGVRQDFKDSLALGWQESVSVRKFLEFAGPEFNWKYHGEFLRKAVNSKNNTQYTLVNQEGCWIDEMVPGGAGTRKKLVGSFRDLLRHDVGIGYVEFKSVDQLVRKKDTKNGLFYPMSPEDKTKEFKAGGRFTKEIKEYQKTYKSWFLQTGADTQLCFRFGPLFHQMSYGAYDEYSSFSIHVYQGRGKSAVEIAEPFIDVVDKAFNKILWAIDESSPRLRMVNYEAIAQLITKLKPVAQSPSANMGPGLNVQPNGIENQINTILAGYKNSLLHIYSTPELEGQKMGGNSKPHYWDEGGIDPLAPAMQTVMDWAEAQVTTRLGINALRDAYTPDPKDGYKLGVEALKQSRNATYFVPFLIERVLVNSCTCSLSIAQDAIEHKTTPVYSFIETLIGEDSLSSFRSLNKIPMHRYAIHVSLFNGEQKREETKQEAFLAFQRGEIKYEEYLIVKELDDTKKAGMLLAFYRNKNEKAAEQAAAIQHARAMEVLAKQTNDKMAIIDREGQWDVIREETKGKYYMAAHQTPADAAIIKKRMDQENNAVKQMERAYAQIAVQDHKKNSEQQAALPLNGTSAGGQ